jgi:hypothetical protein
MTLKPTFERIKAGGKTIYVELKKIYAEGAATSQGATPSVIHFDRK